MRAILAGMAIGLVAVLLLLLVSSAYASTSVADLQIDTQPYRYNPPSFDVCTSQTDVCSEQGQHEKYRLIKADGGSTCPAGYYFVLDDEAREIIPVDTVTCDPTLKVELGQNIKTKKHLIVVEQQGKTVGSVLLEN